MKSGFRQSMAWLHTWTGLLAGWVLLLVFMGGTASYYREEISRWMRPELPTRQVDAAVAADNALAFLRRNAGEAEQWGVTLPDRRNPALRMFWRNPPGVPLAPQFDRFGRGRFGVALVDPASGEAIAARDTLGGDFFYRLHFDLHYIPAIWARWIVGFCAMFMLVAIISGVITHKKIFKDFFTFRPRKGQRSWLDFHNASAVLALPYHAMITYTGIVTLMLLYMPWGVRTAYPDDPAAFFDEAFSALPAPPPADGAAPMTGTPAAIPAMIARARQEWSGDTVARFIAHHPGRAGAKVDLVRDNGSRLDHEAPTLRFDAGDGGLVARSDGGGGASATRGVMYGLHLARFSPPLLRAMFFVSGLLGCLMVASGVILWAIKKRPMHLKQGRIGFGLRLVDALNIGTVAGLPIAFAAIFWANRLLPLQMDARAQAEAHVFFIAWAVALVAAFVRPGRAMWTVQLYAAALLFALLPVVNALTTDAHLGRSLAAGDWALAGFDLVVLGLGLALAATARRLQATAATKPRVRAQAALGAGARS